METTTAGQLEVIDNRSVIESPYDRPMELAIETKDLDKLEKFMELKERHEANEARKAFHVAMSAFKSNPPEIGKNKHVRFKTSKGVTEYDHATLANVTTTINKALSDHGLSAAWKTDQLDKGEIRVTCTVTHVLGHSENTSLSASPDVSGGKNPIQGIGSTVSYLQRYTILALTGLATHDMDDDGASSEPVKCITEDQQIEIDDYLAELYGEKSGAWLKWMGVKSTDEIPATKYTMAINALKDAKEKAGK